MPDSFFIHPEYQATLAEVLRELKEEEPLRREVRLDRLFMAGYMLALLDGTPG
jgi:hypothetical protein